MVKYTPDFHAPASCKDVLIKTKQLICRCVSCGDHLVRGFDHLCGSWLELWLAGVILSWNIMGCPLPSASSHALPAPKPVPNHTGHALRLKRRTEKMTPKEKPRPDRITILDKARSHCYHSVSLNILDLCRVLGVEESWTVSTEAKHVCPGASHSVSNRTTSYLFIE